MVKETGALVVDAELDTAVDGTNTFSDLLSLASTVEEDVTADGFWDAAFRLEEVGLGLETGIEVVRPDIVGSSSNAGFELRRDLLIAPV